MKTASGDFALTMDELREVARFARACAQPVLPLFVKECAGDPRPEAALAAAQTFTEGAARSALQRRAATDAHQAGREAPSEAAQHAAFAAGDAAAAAYLHPLAKATQVRHILGAAAQAARAGELAYGDDPVVAEYLLAAAVKRVTPTVRDVLSRYPRAPHGRARVTVLIQKLDSLLRDPPPAPLVVDDPGPFFHGTKAAVRTGDLLTPGWRSNYGSRPVANHIYITASQEGAPLAATLAQGDGPGHVYRVEPLGTIEDDPNVTDKRFPGNPTRSYRTTEPIRVLEEIHGWTAPPAGLVQNMRARMAEFSALGIEAMD